ncbi:MULTISPECIES: DNA polymerase III subunit beta [unclassified Streptomyces]|uniref:Beta sliding clamp n=2 Tax=Streptomyces TaxID=1883 RepID=A0ABU2RH19_9ACTN|nr:MULTISPECIES: DNA polymerase III subunit beta [unclassified Streptomyces]MYR65802.1 DNA polymerase III subunit beta [Streptomyces sp. SID4939]MYR98779.1 DNA polymerase III subunit beta [Streptomyces sp. SID4940]MYT63564.1 DNA polymerase III subunit beta [Streptomyces sp. SID8357]MYT85814.1 DNA polymerase III subunit beta [Streptomyces sp. SID8360]MYU33003.1 DNA polymerase III subunit beta [Streptomyces sp. SID8358]MYW38635.1 DNA polymerase III subunit beta [Streptomyces sp. SID1]MYX75228.
MKIRVERDVLAEAVAWVARSLPARPPAPVLAGLLLKAEDGALSFSSFDYEVSARVSVDAEIEEDGTVLVSGRLLADICRALPNRPVEISTDGVRATVVCGSSRFTLHTLPVEEYPALPTMPTATGTVPGEVFASAAAQVAIAAGRDDTLPVLTGVRIEIEGDTVTLASTDRYRFAVREFLWKPENPDASAVALVPAKTLLDTAKALTSGDTVTLALSGSGAGEGLIGFEGAGRRTTTRLLEGDLPKYRTLFPTEFNSVAVIETAPFVEAVKRVALVAERNTPVRLSFEQGVLILEAGSSDDAQAVERVDAVLEGDDISIAFNPTFLLDGLSAIDSPVAQLSFTTSTKPALLSGRPAVDAEANDAYKYLIMPVRLSG